MAIEHTEARGLFISYKGYQRLPGNEEKTFDDYLSDYFRAKALPEIQRGLDPTGRPDRLSHFSRICNDLTTLSPRYTDTDIIHMFMLSMEVLDKAKTVIDKNEVLKRWFYIYGLNTSLLFLEKNGKIKEQFLSIIAEDPRFGGNVRAVKDAFYGSPEDPMKVQAIADQILAAGLLLVGQILIDNKETKSHKRVYAEFKMDKKGDPIKSKDKTIISLADPKLLPTFAGLSQLFRQDPKLSKLEKYEIISNFLLKVNELVPVEDQIESLSSDFKVLQEQLAWANSIVGTIEYKMTSQLVADFFAAHIETVARISPALEEIMGELKNLLKEYNSVSKKASPGGRERALAELGSKLSSLEERTESKLRPSGHRP